MTTGIGKTEVGTDSGMQKLPTLTVPATSADRTEAAGLATWPAATQPLPGDNAPSHSTPTSLRRPPPQTKKFDLLRDETAVYP